MFQHRLTFLAVVANEAYAGAVTRAADSLRQDRLLLDEDVQRYIERAAKSHVGR